MKTAKEQRIEQVIESAGKIKKAEVSPLLEDRIIHSIFQSPEQQIQGYPNFRRFAFMISFILIANSAVIAFSIQKNKAQTSSGIEEFAAQFMNSGTLQYE